VSLINTQILPFKAPAFYQGKFVDVSDADLAGKWSVVFFYPGDFTFVCPTELGDLADNYEQFKSLGVEIYSVSTDSHFVHMAWHAESEQVGKVQYYMVGDSSGEITANFDNTRLGAVDADGNRKSVGQSDRATFLIDPDGVIQYVERTAEGIGRSASELLRKVKAAQYVRNHPGEACPAKWEEGAATLTPSIDLIGKI
jgi:NADH-dependent peroxiredoxin subunit C